MDELEKIEIRFPWSFLGVVLALIFGFFGVYFATHRPVAHISAKVINEANVLDVHRPLKELLVQFQGEDIQEKKLNLRIYSIKIENDGSVDILQSHYDQDTVWGLKFGNARIVEQPRLVAHNSKYLETKLRPSLVDDNIISLKKVIFEQDKYFLLEILVIHDVEKLPTIEVLGKVAGIEQIPIKSEPSEKQQLSFWAEFFYGNVLVHILRIILYPAVVCGLGWLGFHAANLLTEFVREKKAVRRLRPLEPFLADLGEEIRRLIYHSVLSGLGPKDFSVARDIISEVRHTGRSVREVIEKSYRHPERMRFHGREGMRLLDEVYHYSGLDHSKEHAGKILDKLTRVFDALAQQ